MKRSVIVKSFLLLALFLSATFTAVVAEAAQLSFAPGVINVTLKPGESASLPFTANLSNFSGRGSANFGVDKLSGELSWATGTGLSLNYRSTTGQGTIQVAVPADAAGGDYTAVFGAVNVIASEALTADTFTVSVEVDAPTCSEAPRVVGLTADKNAIEARNGKPVTVVITGSIVSAEGCTQSGAFYQVDDEYNELDSLKTLSLAGDGSFRVEVPLVASRKGNDKDGRSYTLTFGAENEAGASADAISFVVAHDNR